MILSGFLVIPALAGWTPAVRISEQATSYGPKIAANGDALHVVYWKGGEFISCYYLRSEDGGGIWSAPFHLADTNHTSNNVLPIVMSTGDTITIIWRGNIRGGGTDMNFGLRLSTNNGSSWNNIEYVLAEDRQDLQEHTYTISNSTLFFLFSEISGQEIVVQFTKGMNYGETWTNPSQVFSTQQTGRFNLVAEGNTIHVVWAGQFTWDYPVWETYYLKSEDGGQTWTDNLSLGSIDELGSMYPSIAINERGDLVVCWVDFKYSPYWWTGDLFVRYSYDAGETWLDEEPIMMSHTAESPRILWKGDTLHIAWEDARNGGADPYYMASYNNGLTWSDPQRIDENEYNSHAPDIAVKGQNVHIVWDDRRQDDQGRGIYYSRWDEEVGIAEESEILPSEIILSAYPNPFNGNITITYNGLEGGEIEIYNIRGQKIRMLSNTTKEGETKWDARDALGNRVSSGIYFARAAGVVNSMAMKLVYIR